MPIQGSRRGVIGGGIIFNPPPNDPPTSGTPTGPAASGTTTLFTPSIIPFASPELLREQGGLTDWNLSADRYSMCPVPEPPGIKQPLRQIYLRDEVPIYWRNVETSLGVYDWSYLESQAVEAARRNGQVGFRFMCMDAASDGTPGSGNTVPDYIQNNQGTYGGNGQVGNGYRPNFNNSAFLARIVAVMASFASHYANDPRIGPCDIGFYGKYAEWHMFQVSDVPAITLANAKIIIDACVDQAPNIQWLQLYGNSAVSDAVAYAMAKNRTSGKPVGWRNDAAGHRTQGKAQEGSACWLGGAFPQIDQWKVAPVYGEIANLNPNDSTYDGPGTGSWLDVLAQVQQYHHSYIGNGNTGGSSFGDFSDQMKQAWIDSGKHAGARWELRTVTIPNKIEAGSHATIRAEWINVGVAPNYQPWHVKWILKNPSGAIVWIGTSTMDFKFVLPSPTPGVVSENFNFPSGLQAGGMTLCVRVDDPAGYFLPMQLPLPNRGTDGSYPVANILTA